MTLHWNASAKAEIKPGDLDKVLAAAEGLDKAIQIEHDLPKNTDGKPRMFIYLSVGEQMSYGMATTLEEDMLEFLGKYKKKDTSITFGESSDDDERPMSERLIGPRELVVSEAMERISERIMELMAEQRKILKMARGNPRTEITIDLGVL